MTFVSFAFHEEMCMWFTGMYGNGDIMGMPCLFFFETVEVYSFWPSGPVCYLK